MDSHVPKALAEIAESHLAHTLLRKKHTIADVQAILLLAAWGLQSGGKGPDAWVLTGHAARVSRRLGIQRAVGQAVAATQKDRSQLEAPAEVDTAVLRQWRTCFDSFLSFGFGRPQSTQFESIDDQAFLKARLSHPLPRSGTQASLSLYGDAYIAAKAQLAVVARSFVLWVEEQARSGPPDSQSLLSMLWDLNGRLDDWCKLWVWSGSSHALYLGASARIARLQAEHLRLSINAMALRSSTHSEGHEGSITYLRKALIAATSTIQTHFESSQTDLALSFATDVGLRSSLPTSARALSGHRTLTYRTRMLGPDHRRNGCSVRVARSNRACYRGRILCLLPLIIVKIGIALGLRDKIRPTIRST
ncbi:hypothetical protein IG631_23141 [Alternaria alternata]|nr:hypothetical protein IG631_23141 [Alternaria alternata]